MRKLPVDRKPSREQYDIAIIGAGVSGALAAAQLIGLGKSVVILDRRGPASGSTTASTAMIQWEIDEPLTRLSDALGAPAAARAYRSSIKGVLALRRTILSLGIACDWADRTALTITGDAMGQRAMADELKLRLKLGLPSAWVEGRELLAAYGIDRTAALLNGFNGELNPVKLTHGLLRAAVADGMELVAPVNVTEIATSARRVHLTLENGGALEAGKVIVCAGYEALPQIPRDLYKLVSTWALATAPLDVDLMLPARPIVWEQSAPYLYFRTTADNRIVVGGEDESLQNPERAAALVPAKVARILEKLKALLPAFEGTADYAWSGTFATSPTGLPAIGPVPGLRNVFTTLGAGGNGITFSAIAAALSKDWVLGHRSRDLVLYRIAR